MNNLVLRRNTRPVQIGSLTVGGTAPIRVQAMTNTDTADARATVAQVEQLARAGAELVRITVNTHEAAAQVATIRDLLNGRNISVPLVGDFHFNGHRLLATYPECAQALDKYRINPGNVGKGVRRDEQFCQMIEVDGEYLDAARADLRSLRQKVGMVFQQFNLFPHLTVGENVMLAPQVVQKVPKAKAAQLARQMLERVGLGEKFDAFPDRLSGGQQQRVAIARALAMSPKVLLCDEITSALDPELVNEVLSVVRQLAKDGMTLIMVTHEMRFAREVGDKLVFMHQGKVHEVGDPKVLFANPQTAELANFIGSTEQPG